MMRILEFTKSQNEKGFQYSILLTGMSESEARIAKEKIMICLTDLQKEFCRL